MSASNCLLTEEQLLCCVCLDVFTDPVTLPCGHNFCKSCIMEHLNFNSQRQCPMCKEHVEKKYKLRVNTFISEMAVQFRQSAGKKDRKIPKQQAATPANVPQDVHAGPKWTSLRSCLFIAVGITCLVFFIINLYCHQIISSIKMYQLYDFLQKVVENVSTEQDKPLDLSYVGPGDRFHEGLSLREEYELKKKEIWETEAKIHKMVQERRRRVQEFKHSVKVGKVGADGVMEEGVQVFTALIRSLERAQTELVEMIEQKQKATEKEANANIQELEQEISGLTKRRAEVEQLSRSKDPLHFLQSFSALNSAPPTKDWTDVSICPVRYDGITRAAIVRALNQLAETVREEMQRLEDAQFKNLRQNAADVALDPDTAHPALVLSDDGKQVHCGDVWRKLPDNPKRFQPALNVLGKQSFSCGQFHYDVQVKGKTRWTLGVAKRSANRKGDIMLNPENGYWTICLKNINEYFALASQPVPLPVNNHPDKVRVFVDYEEGLVSFYDVDAAVLLHSFTGNSFTEGLYPFFSPGPSDSGRNSAPLIISSVNLR
ncbi:nuclear factor 7, brain-like [Mugil cephalus]|uniref:nuclear factor 7, brain-like n=1 Tax=Mugil cephalus TaxID=48193 RepID=UPI001FB6A6CB|nr:nuclear factor 7, brain-like [Mugil cephalus]XP_047430706.1 nuclear factor 7, brain-like [Mugil cephalus]XP_047430707.1 nuclear factor 7, brain-like [Mugil cephalus]